MTLSPRARAARVISRPKPEEQAVMSQTLEVVVMVIVMLIWMLLIWCGVVLMLSVMIFMSGTMEMEYIYD